MPKLTLKETEDVGYELGKTAGHMTALGELLMCQHSDPCHDQETLYGLGDLVCRIGKDVKEVADLMMYGPEEKIMTSNSSDINKEDEVSKDDEADEDEKPTPLSKLLRALTMALEQIKEEEAMQELEKRESGKG